MNIHNFKKYVVTAYWAYPENVNEVKERISNIEKRNFEHKEMTGIELLSYIKNICVRNALETIITSNGHIYFSLMDSNTFEDFEVNISFSELTKEDETISAGGNSNE